MTPKMALADAIRLGEAGYRAGAWADGMTGVSSSAEADRVGQGHFGRHSRLPLPVISGRLNFGCYSVVRGGFNSLIL